MNETALNYGSNTNEANYFRIATTPNESTFSPKTVTSFKECNGFSSWYNCSSSSLVSSYRRVAVAYDDEKNASVYAWNEQDRSTFANNWDLRIAIGNTNDWTVGKSYSAGVRSPVGPGVACKSNATGGYDCLVAYTDITDPNDQVRFRRFYSYGYSWLGHTHYTPFFQSGFQTLSSSGSTHRTTSDIAVWYSYSKWWVAFRPSSPSNGQAIRVYSSASGATGTWSYEKSLTYSNLGPEVATDASSGNRIWLHR